MLLGAPRAGSNRTSGRHTTHLQDLPPEVTVVRKRHPFVGQSLRVFGWMRRQGSLDLILVLPDGSRSLIPAAWTDVGAEETAGAAASEVLGSLGELQRMRVVIDGLIHRSRDANGQDRGEDPGEVTGAAATGTRRRGRGPRSVGDTRGTGSGGGDRTSGGDDGQRGRANASKARGGTR